MGRDGTVTHTMQEKAIMDRNPLVAGRRRIKKVIPCRALLEGIITTFCKQHAMILTLFNSRSKKNAETKIQDFKSIPKDLKSLLIVIVCECWGMLHLNAF